MPFRSQKSSAHQNSTFSDKGFQDEQKQRRQLGTQKSCSLSSGRVLQATQQRHRLRLGFEVQLAVISVLVSPPSLVHLFLLRCSFFFARRVPALMATRATCRTLARASTSTSILSLKMVVVGRWCRFRLPRRRWRRRRRRRLLSSSHGVDVEGLLRDQLIGSSTTLDAQAAVMVLVITIIVTVGGGGGRAAVALLLLLAPPSRASRRSSGDGALGRGACDVGGGGGRGGSGAAAISTTIKGLASRSRRRRPRVRCVRCGPRSPAARACPKARDLQDQCRVSDVGVPPSSTAAPPSVASASSAEWRTRMRIGRAVSAARGGGGQPCRSRCAIGEGPRRARARQRATAYTHAQPMEQPAPPPLRLLLLLLSRSPGLPYVPRGGGGGAPEKVTPSLRRTRGCATRLRKDEAGMTP